jgi:hypothetical protein
VAQILGLILLVALFIYAFQLALILLILAGLIFRTKETVGLLLILAIFAGFAAYPLMGTGMLAALLLYLFVKNGSKADPPPQE